MSEEAVETIDPYAKEGIYCVEVTPGRLVHFREMTIDEFEACVLAADGDMSWRLTQAGLQRSIIAIERKPVNYEDLMGGQMNKMFKVRELLLLRNAWELVHMPPEEEVRRVKQQIRAW